MKSRKALKKEIKKTYNTLYKDIIFYKAFVVGADRIKARDILDKMIVEENDLIKRVSVNEGREVKGRVKKYFTKLREDLIQKTNKIADAIAALP